MSDYRRCFVKGGCYFFTVVSHRRRPLFDTDGRVELLRQAMREVKGARPFEIQAMVVMPDHVHAVWQLPDGDSDFLRRWRDIKHHVSRRIDAAVNLRGEKSVWQRRFWEHLIRDQEDWRRHVDYVHFNPVKHGLVTRAGDWRYRSFLTAVRKGWYGLDWGCMEPEDIRDWRLE
ncbi:REP-associated tyrosine transposase [Thiocystis violacea]|uniref:REP-associated tyrosine transposase n=1 Tax=Thiocystis violacea TaxID=13725 RepID=UPI001906F277|nr:transposase [Thiocystis violacea]MBK1724912.1 transposase [Thiocystis violacea]